MTLKVIIKAEVKFTEDPEKVKSAILNIFDVNSIKRISEGGRTYLVAEGIGIKSLFKVHKLLREQRILDAAHRIIKKGLKDDQVTFYLHKQAAYAGKLSLCESYVESPMGPIEVKVYTKDPVGVLEWLAPRTIGGIVKEREPPEV